MFTGEEKGDSVRPRLETNDVDDDGLSAAVVPFLTARRPNPPCAWNAWVGLDHVAAAAAASTTSSASTINTKATTHNMVCGLFSRTVGQTEFHACQGGVQAFFSLVNRPRFRCAPNTHTQPATHQTPRTTVWLESASLQGRGRTAEPCVVSAELRSLQQHLSPQERASTVPPPHEMRCSRRVSCARFLLT